jgi:ferric-dicitrate binding protein FerR (iron transport regulator)
MASVSGAEGRDGVVPMTEEVIQEGAIRWLLWLRVDDGAEREFAACERWCAQSVAHADAMHDVLWLWAALRMLGVNDLH